MLRFFGRRRFRKAYVAFLTILASLFIISNVKHHDSTIIITNSNNREDHDTHIFCILLHTQPTDEKFLNITKITWAKNCHSMNVVRYKQLSTSDNDLAPAKIPYHVNLWTRLLIGIRQSISSDESISNRDSLVIVPAPTFVFQEKLTSLLYGFKSSSEYPLIIIYEYQHINAYILNGEALDLVRNTQLIDTCLQESYPSAREKHLWKCVKTTLSNEQTDFKCKNKDCFIQYRRNLLRIADIKDGICLQKNVSSCQSIPLLYPVTFSDMITLEFFKYRLKPKH